MDEASCIYNGQRISVSASKDISVDNSNSASKDISTDNSKKKYNPAELFDCRCPCCYAPAHLVVDHRRKTHFRAFHHPDCSIVNDGQKHRTHRVTVDITVDDLESILAYIDKEPRKSPPPPPEGPTGTKGPKTIKEIDDEDKITEFVTTRKHTLSGIISLIKGEGLDVQIAGMPARDCILTLSSAQKAKENGIHGIKIVILKRFSPSAIDPPLPYSDEWTYLCDAYHADVKESFIFRVKLKKSAHNYIFRGKVYGNNKHRKDPSPFIVILGNWKETTINDKTVYSSEINSHSYCFVDNIDFIFE